MADELPDVIRWRGLALKRDQHRRLRPDGPPGSFRAWAVGRWKVWLAVAPERWNALWQCGDSELMMHTDGATVEEALEACLSGLSEALDDFSLKVEQALHAVVQMNEVQENARRDVFAALQYVSAQPPPRLTLDEAYAAMMKIARENDYVGTVKLEVKR